MFRRLTISGLTSAVAASVFLALSAISHNAAEAALGIDLVPISYVFDGIASAKNVLVTAYTLSPESDMVRRLLLAAHHGAHVSVGLDATAFESAATANDTLASTLELSNIEVHKIPTSHIKAVVLDNVIYLSDRNWPASDNQQVVVRDTLASDRRILETAIFGGRLGANDHLWTKKADALKAEAAVISARTSDEIDVETETFGAGTPVFEAIGARAAGGDHVKLLVASSDYARSSIARRAIANLQARHVEVRLTNANEKFAIEGYNCWVGSANATRDLTSQIEFGMAFRDAGMATTLHGQFVREWSTASDPPRYVPASSKRKSR